MRKATWYRFKEEGVPVIWHAWGMMSSEDGAYPAAIIEKEDGAVLVVEADQIQFTTPWSAI